MGNEMLDVEHLAAYLQRDAREVGKLASRGHLPGHRVGGEWRFPLAEINHWIETQLPTLTDAQLTALETTGNPAGDRQPLLPELLSEATIAVPLQARTRASVLRELVTLAEQSWQVYDPEAILTSIRAREEMECTALPSTGVAIPHPHRPLPGALGEAVVAFGRTTTGIPFGAPRGELTDLFFLVCCRDSPTHLRVLARLSRLMLRPGFLDALRETQTAGEAHELLTRSERELLEE